MIDPGAAGLLGTIGGRLNGAASVLEIRPIVSEHGHEITGLRVATADGIYTVHVERV